MKKYMVIKPFSTNKSRLVINGDILFGEEFTYEGKIISYHLYHPETRKYIGSIETINGFLKKE